MPAKKVQKKKVATKKAVAKKSTKKVTKKVAAKTETLPSVKPPLENRGVRLGKQPTDYIAGVNSPLAYQIILDDGNWKPYTPTPEVQWGKGGDKMNCVTQSYHNVCETRLTYLIQNGKLPERHLSFLRDNGYIDANGKVNFNDRISAILNNTTKDGNWLYVVADSARNYGLFPETILPSDENLSWEEYYNKALITPEILEVGKKFRELFEMPYEWVSVTQSELLKHLKHAPLQIVFPNHAVCEVFGEADIVTYFDTYDPFIKTINRSYLTSAMKIIINPIGVEMTKFFKVQQGNKSGIGVSEGFSLSLLFEDKAAEYAELLKLVNMPADAPVVQIPTGKFFKLQDGSKLGILVVEGFSGTGLYENDFVEYKTLLQITGVPDKAPTVQIP